MKRDVCVWVGGWVGDGHGGLQLRLFGWGREGEVLGVGKCLG